MTIAFLAGHACNYVLFWGADHILDSGRFGVFYTAVLTTNIVMAPMMAVTLALTRRFAEIGVRFGHDNVVASTRHLLTLCLQATPFVAGGGIVLSAIATWIGIESWPIALLIPMTVLALVEVEILRMSLQSMLLFARASALWIVNTGCQLVFALGLLFLYPRAWAGLAGVLAGAVVAVAVFLPGFVAPRHQGRTEPFATVPLRIAQEFPTMISYSLFILFNNVDILLGYCVLSRADLDIYAASALLPKAIVTATFAIAQVVLPVITQQRSSGFSLRLPVAKAVAITIASASAAAILLWIILPFLQQTPLAIRSLDLGLAGILGFAAIAVSTLRMLVVVEIALQQRHILGFAQSGAIILLILLCANSNVGPIRLAELYAITAGGLLLLVGGGLLMLRSVHPEFAPPAARQTRKR